MEFLLLLIVPVVIAIVVVARRRTHGRHTGRHVVPTGNPPGKRYDGS